MTVFLKRLAPAFAVALLLAGSNAKANTIAPGGTIPGVPNNAAAPASTLSGTFSGPYTIGSGATGGTGTYSAAVYTADAANGGLTSILFTVSVTTGDVNRVTLTDFTGFTTDVFRVSGQNTTFVDRVGGTLGFQFNNPVGGVAIGLDPGETATYLIRTNAPSFRTGAINLIDGGVSANASFGPAVPLPAPVWMGLTLLGGAGGIGRLKKFFRRDQAC